MATAPKLKLSAEQKQKMKMKLLPKLKVSVKNKLNTGPTRLPFDVTKYVGWQLGAVYYHVVQYTESGFHQGTEDHGAFGSMKEAVAFVDRLEPNKEIQHFTFSIRMEMVKEKWIGTTNKEAKE